MIDDGAIDMPTRSPFCFAVAGIEGLMSEKAQFPARWNRISTAIPRRHWRFAMALSQDCAHDIRYRCWHDEGEVVV